jgi:hypothetical protein
MRKVKTATTATTSRGSRAINISASGWAIIDGEFIIRDTRKHGGERRSK